VKTETEDDYLGSYIFLQSNIPQQGLSNLSNMRFKFTQ